MKTKIAKIIFLGVFAAVLCFSRADIVVADSNFDLSVRIQSLERQILLLRIQLIQQRIAQLQEELSRINSSSAKANVDLIYPSGGEHLANRNSYYIRWGSSGVEKITIELITPENGKTIASNVSAADGRYYWNPGNISGDKYRIRIFDSSNPSISSRSNGDFSIFDGTLANRCEDGTMIGKCSTDKPKLCFGEEIGLVDACRSCGCPSGFHCDSDSKCR